MSEAIVELLALQKKADVPAISEQQLSVPTLPEHPDVEEASRALQEAVEQARAVVETAQRTLQEKIGQSLARIVPTQLLELEKEHSFSESFNSALEVYERFGLFEGNAKQGMLMSPKEVRDGAPSIGNFMDGLKEQPELLEKIKQGFVKVHPVPVGLSPVFMKEAMRKAIESYYDKEPDRNRLRSSDGTKLNLDTSEPVWMWDAYEGADKSGELVYFPERFDPKNHGGKTKKQILEASKFPGWQVLLTENLRDIPREGNGQTVGGRAQIEANSKAHEYLTMMQNNNEQGLTPEAWMTLFLRRIAETEGEVLDDYNVGAACYCTGAYFPSSGVVPRAYWVRFGERADVDRFGPGCRFSVDGARAGVRVL
ncbi:hypothetical protein KKF55_04180 [Patescibacteria group bacterium]|nr:hypothetical protein [Patescibacteria group bacterium]